jgi:micrococcal nuclease
MTTKPQSALPGKAAKVALLLTPHRHLVALLAAVALLLASGCVQEPLESLTGTGDRPSAGESKENQTLPHLQPAYPSTPSPSTPSPSTDPSSVPAASSSSVSSESSTPTEPGSAFPAYILGEHQQLRTIERVVDGDTIIVDGGERVRLIGIDAPESVHPSRPVECFGPEASDALKIMAPLGAKVVLTFDAERTDVYGRTLAYLSTPISEDVGLDMLMAGFVTTMWVSPNTSRSGLYGPAEEMARTAQAGLWGACGSR